jgi:hypothetical protein
VDTLGGTQQVIAVNESGLYHVILRSDKPEAAPFRKWVTSEVLPTLRKTGSYMMPKMTKEMQAIFLLDNRTAQLDQRVTALENNAVIDYGQQRTLANAVNHRVIVDVLGGKNSPAYEDVHVRGRVFCECNKGVHLNRPPFICIQTCRSITVFGNAEDVAHVLQDKPRFAAHLYGADFVGLVVENLNITHAFTSCSAI